MENNAQQLSRSLKLMNGWVALTIYAVINFFIGLLCVHALATFINAGGPHDGASVWSISWPIVSLIGILALMLNSLVILTPKQGLIAQFAGKYKGEYVKHGFFAKNPFYGITTYNLGQQNATTEVLKINDKDGNPIMIQAVLVYKIISMYKTHYDVVNSSAYLLQQANASLRAITKKFSYKNNEFNENFENELLSEINKYAAIAGFEVESAHTTELSYAPEIAGAMLQKQQAEATIDAKKSLVEGAVSIVKETIEALSKENNGVQLDEESKRRLTVNLLTVLAGEQRPIATIPISDSVH